jgi:Domain of unknown function (DUF4262)
MCWMCDHPGSTVEDYLDEVRRKIQTYGWAIQYVEDDRRPYAYTIGRTPFGLPELLVTGVSPVRAHHLLHDFADRIEGTLPLKPGTKVALSGRDRVEVVKVEHPEAHMGAAIGLYGYEVRAMQLVWADARGRWPWSADFDEGRGTQPVLGVRAPCN